MGHQVIYGHGGAAVTVDDLALAAALRLEDELGGRQPPNLAEAPSASLPAS